MATLCQQEEGYYHVSRAAQGATRRREDLPNVLCAMLARSRQPLQPSPLQPVLCVTWGISVQHLGSFSAKHALLVTTPRCLAVWIACRVGWDRMRSVVPLLAPDAVLDPCLR